MMVITTTAVAFTFSSIGLAICGFWFYRAFQKIGEQRPGGKIGILLSVLFISIAIQHGILALGGWFFAGNAEALFAVLAIDTFVLSAVAALSVYLAFYIILPKISPWFATAVTFLFGVLVTGLIITIHPQPFVSIKNSIDWNAPQRLDALIYLLLILNIGSIFIIFTKNFFYANTRDVKIISFIISLLAFAGIINVSILLTPLLNAPVLRTHIFDVIMGIIGLVFIAFFLFIPIIAGWSKKRSNNNQK